MKAILITLLCINSIVCAYALSISEIMSNPVGDDGGREWVELYNNTDSNVDLTGLTVSIKGGSFVAVTPVSGGTNISSHGYAIIGSTVSGATRFMQDYPSYSGPLFKSSISLVNTGVTSLEIKLGGTSADILSSYTAAKEGSTYSLIDGSFVTGIPTPGEDNKVAESGGGDATSTPPTPSVTIPQMAPPSADITLYLPLEKVVVAGAPSLFSVYALTRSGSSISNMTYTWSFGDGGERSGGTTTYRYFYPGRYVAQVEGTNGLIAGTARMLVRVVPPDISMSNMSSGKYGSYIDITNPNNYDLDISGWKLTIDGVPFSFPKNTLLSGGVTHFPGLAMGFASTTVSSSTLLKLLFPNMDEVLRVTQGGNDEEKEKVKASPFNSAGVSQERRIENKIVTTINPQSKIFSKQLPVFKNTTTTSPKATSSYILATNTTKKDTRLATFLKSLLGR